jgi:hypothetical protein
MSEDKNLFYISHNSNISQYTDSGFRHSLQKFSFLRLLLVDRVFYVSKQEIVKRSVDLVTTEIKIVKRSGDLVTTEIKIVKRSGDLVTTEIKISNSVTQPNIYVFMV